MQKYLFFCSYFYFCGRRNEFKRNSGIMNMRIITFLLVTAVLFDSVEMGAQVESKRMAVVELSTVYMRQKPDYESALETQELMGSVVEIMGEKGYWREIQSPQPYRAWVTELGLVEMDAEQLEAYENAPKYIFTGLYGHLYEEADENSNAICDLVAGNILRAVIKPGVNSEKSAITNKDCIKKGCWVMAKLPSGKEGWIRKESVELEHIFRNKTQASVENIISWAYKFIGVPYLWGGMSPKGLDCSGLVRVCHFMNNYYLPRNASQQINYGVEIPLDFKELKRGDLLFFGQAAHEGKPMRVTHIGIYLGNNKFIHSSHLVRINSLREGDEDYYENSHRLIAARRLEYPQQ